jgi:hypothetical protein
MDEAGPFQAVPYPGGSWQPEGEPARYPHEYVRGGTAKMMTLFHPSDGSVRVKGVESCPNAVLHGWLKAELSAILEELPQPEVDLSPEANRRSWEVWQDGLSVRITLSEVLPGLRMLLVLDNLAGHKSVDLVLWLFDHGIMPLYTPLGGSWLNMTESVQRIIKRRALEGHHPKTTGEVIEWLEATARGWNAEPTPFQWGGRRQDRRRRAREKRHRLGGSGAWTAIPIHRLPQEWQLSMQMTH